LHLSDCFIKTFAYVSYLLASVETRKPGYEQVKGDIQQLIRESEMLFAQGGFSRDDYDLARFAVCAWVDEALLNSPWEERNLWLKDQLQRRYYSTTDAGEEFFDRLNVLGLHQREVREVYYLCLAIGFTGRYCHPGDEYQLEQIKTSNLKLLLGSSVGLPSLERTDLFPEAHPSSPPETGKQRILSGSRLLKYLCLAGPVLLFCLLFLIYRFTLGGVGDNFLRTVAN
jgi:type VI secretion system protein ImpK